MHYERRKFILDDSEHARSAIGRYEKPMPVRTGRSRSAGKGYTCPTGSSTPAQQRLTHAALNENKSLGDLLAFIKAQQEADAPQFGPVGKQRTCYTPSGKRGGGKKGWG